MTTQKKLEKKGYKITYNMGYKNGEQCIVSVTATNIKGGKVTRPTITELNKILTKKAF